MATRTRKQTIPTTPFVETVTPESVAPETPESFAAKFDWAYLIKGEASWKRVAVAAIASLATSAAIGYVGGHLIAYLTVAAVLVSSSLFIAYFVYALSFLLLMYASYRASMFAYVKVLDKSVDAVCASAYDKVASLFAFGASKETQHA